MTKYNLPYMLYADERGIVYDHPYYRMAGFSGNSPFRIKAEDLIPMPRFSKLFFIPDCPPIGIDPETGKPEVVEQIELDGSTQKCFAVASFLEPGFVRSHLPAVDYSKKKYTLPMWGYTAVGFKNDSYYTTGFRIEYNRKWDPKNYDDTNLIKYINDYQNETGHGPLVDHLVNCAINNHCFAAKNLFFKRWEAPLPVSRHCNAACLGCLSLQPDDTCSPSHQRISFTPDIVEIVSLAVNHLKTAEEAIVSFGQGCEGEPLTEYGLISKTIREIRKLTPKGTINLNTNGSLPDRVREIAESGLDSIRISLNCARKEYYLPYYRPKGYVFEDVISSIRLSKDMGLYTMINYLVFPGITDQEEEIEALENLIERTGLNFIHMKNLNIDPWLYLGRMPDNKSRGIGMKKMTERIKMDFPDVELGYFNQPIEKTVN
jgi:pyruvate-formate lyase-activating enzyme